MRIPLKLGVHSEACFGGKNNEYRFLLRRTWDKRLPACTFAMLNPSTADTDSDDPTIAKCQAFCRLWGFGTLIVVNAFALRSPNPRDLRRHPEPVGNPQNDVMIAAAAAESDYVVCAWGKHAEYLNRGQQVRKLLAGRGLKALKLNQDGSPRHPLYIPLKAELISYA